MSLKISSLAVTAIVACLAAARPAHATCGVRVIIPAGLRQTAWETEASHLERRFAPHWKARDCASVEVRIENNGSGAWMTYAERGQSVARRHLANANELAPAVRALLVRVDSDFFSGDKLPPPDVVAPPAPERRDNRLSYAFGGLAGMRLGIAGGTAVSSPAWAAFASVLANRWELGVSGQWESGYRQAVTDQEPDWVASALSFGVVAGRRFSLQSWDIATGISFSAAIVHGLSDDEFPHTEANGADGRVGVYLGFVGSRTAPFRFRANLGLDFVPRRVGVARISEAAPANLPWWMGAISMGVEAAP